MIRKQFEPLVVHLMDLEQFSLPPHRHTYYEMIYVLRGCGNHFLNSNVIPYKSGDLFLLSPEDKHHFVFTKPSKLVFIKFTSDYFQRNKYLSPDSFLKGSPETVMRKPVLKEVKLKFDEPCDSILKKTIENILSYNCLSDISTSPIVFFQILSIFGLIEEGAAKLNLGFDEKSLNRENLISYIHQNIYYPPNIRIQTIAHQFNISPNYFSNYFKRNFDISFREYINKYKMSLIEKRILSGHKTIKEIAYEFGFTDESHLTNFFKRKKLISPTKYIAEYDW